MKKMLFLGALVLTFASCKKDYTCECKSNYMGVVSTATYTFKDTKSGATTKCSSMATTVTIDSMTMSNTCTLK